MWKARNILIGITGSIAAYKMAFLTRLLVKKGAHVRIIMTPAATDFISPLTLSTLSQNEVLTEISSAEQWNNHVEMGIWADLFLIAPATANTLARCCNGLADNLLVATYLSAKCPVVFAPAMDLDMWQHPTTKSNIEKLQTFGHHIIDVGEGFLASGLEGKGRMAEPEEILRELEVFLSKEKGGQQAMTRDSMTGQRILITAGPTYENIDPVRFIGNRSSGKMGVALARKALEAGAEVHLVLGPSSVELPEDQNLHLYRVHSAREMFEHCKALFSTMTGAIFAAAVSDYRPENISEQKIKKSTGDWSLQLERTEDIASTLGAEKNNGQWTVGFALETEEGTENARQKLERKHFDLIVLNSLQDEGAGFEKKTNKVTLIDKQDTVESFPLKSKTAVAQDILEVVVSKLIKS